MDIYEYLKKDHKKVAGLFEQLVAARSDTSRENILQEIRDELLLHAKTEEATFYTALEECSETHLNELMPEAEEEHDTIRDFFKQIDAAKTGAPRWFILVGSLKQAVEHHVEEEEGLIFKHARQVLSNEQARALAQEMDAMKQEEEPDSKRIHKAPRAA